MKKISKKVSFLTKILLIVGLLVSDLMPLKTVFAYEKDDSLVLTLNDTTLNIKYTGDEITNENLNITVEETYKYLDETEDNNTKEYSSVTLSELKETGISHETILSNVKFDGTYKATVTVTNKIESEEDESIVLTVNDITSEKTFDKGIIINVYQADGTTKVEKTNGKYNVDDDYQIKIGFNAGGLAPTWTYTYEFNETSNEAELSAEELIKTYLNDTINLNGYLGGEYLIPEKISLTSSKEETMSYDEEINVLYKSYAYNTETLNNKVTEKEVFLFEGDSKEGTLYVYPDLENNTQKTIEDVTNILESTYGESEIITYSVSGEELTNDTVVSLKSGDLEVTYNVELFADIDGDGIVTSKDLEEIINSIVGVSQEDLTREDINNDKKLDLNDAVYLLEMLKNKTRDITLGKEEGTLTAYLNEKNNNIYSGDTFEVDYIVSLKETPINGIYGKVNYDSSLFSLVELTNKQEWTGNNKDGKFLYLGSNSLSLKTTDETNEDGETTTSYEEIEYTVLTLKFKALKSGTGDISINDYKFINGVNTVSSSSISKTITVNASSDANLKSLTVGEQEISLKDTELDYSITVANDVTSVDVNAVPNNSNAKVTSIIKPEELDEGENTITITVEAENGDEQIYTITVTREAKEEEPEETEEENVTPTNNAVNNNGNNNKNNNNNNNNNNNDNKQDITPSHSQEEDSKKDEVEENKLSRIIIIILILLVIAGLIYLIFKDDNDDDETKKTNKEINKIKKEDEKEVARKVSSSYKEQNTKRTTKSRTNNKNIKKDK